MAASPIYVEPGEEIPAVLERIGQQLDPEVPLVVPARSRFGQSRFNYQLLKQYTVRMGKRVTIISPDPAVQKMAQENGFSAAGALSALPATQYEPAPPAAWAPAAPVPPVTDVYRPTGAEPEPAWADRIPASRREPAAESDNGAGAASRFGGGGGGGGAAAALDSLRGLGLPAGLAGWARAARPGRLLLYGAAALILIVGIVAVVFLLPTADVTLVAQSTPFSTDATVTADPGKPPIGVRVVTPDARASHTFNASGTKVLPGAVAKGTVTFDAAGCLVFGFHIPNGTRLVGPGGVQFATQGGDVDVGGQGNPKSATTAIVAIAPGDTGNVQPGAYAFVNPGAGSCIQIQGSGTSGGTNDQKKTVISSTDVSSARAALQQQLQQQVQADLSKAGQPGEKMNAQIQWTVASFNTDHSSGDEATGFTATMDLRGEGDFFHPADVTRAFSDALRQKVPADKQMVGNVDASYDVTASSGGHLTFAGKASGFVAPKLDLEAIKAKVSGKSASQAQHNLNALPVQSATIQQHPFKLPFMPLFGSRVRVDYQLVQPPAPTAAPAPKS